MTNQERYQEDIAQMTYLSEWKQKKEERRTKRRQAVKKLLRRLKGGVTK